MACHSNWMLVILSYHLPSMGWGKREICHSLPVSFMVRRGSIPCWSMSGWILHCYEQLSRTSKMSHKTLLYGSSQQLVWIKKQSFQNGTMMSSWHVKSFCFTGPVILMFFLLIAWTCSWTEVARGTFDGHENYKDWHNIGIVSWPVTRSYLAGIPCILIYDIYVNG